MTAEPDDIDVVAEARTFLTTFGLYLGLALLAVAGAAGGAWLVGTFGVGVGFVAGLYASACLGAVSAFLLRD